MEKADVRVSGDLFDDGEAYERLMGRWSRRIAATFLDWLKVPPGLRWLDVGCGNGAFTEELIAHCEPVEVAAIDPSEEQIAYARARPGAKMANFRAGDAQQLPFGDNTFDVAAMGLVISFLSDPNKAAAEMARVVRPGGWIAAYMWDIPGGGLPAHPIHLAMEEMGMASVRPRGSAMSERNAMQRIWESTGLISVDTTVVRIRTVYPDVDDYWKSNVAPVGPLGKLIAGAPADTREELRSRLRNSLSIATDGSVVFEAFANAVKGRTPE